MARSAANCLRANNMESKIDLVPKASTEMKEVDLQASRRADIIVNELYDTELLGEGVLPTLRHALEHLASPTCVVVPAAADVVAVLLQSDALFTGYHPTGLTSQGGTKIFPQAQACVDATSSAIWATTYVSESVFLDKLVIKQSGVVLSDPLLVSTIDFCSPPPHGTHAGETLALTATSDGMVHAIAYWWDLKMCPGDENPLAAHPAPVSVSWRGRAAAEHFIAQLPRAH